MPFGQYAGTAKYIASDALRSVVDAAVVLGRPLLVKGEPGTGKTLLASSVAEALGMPLLRWHVKSTSKAQDGLYHYDVVQRLNDSRFGDGDVSDIARYIKLGVLGRAFEAPDPVVVLLDEIDKADLEFPNDLLNELDEMRFTIHETGREVKAARRPVVVITSNAEKELPDAFLRRCVFHYIEFPTPDLMTTIVGVHFPDVEANLLQAVLDRFYYLRGIDALRKKPSTSELLDWLYVLQKGGVSPERVRKEIPYLGALIKKETDLSYLRSSRRLSG